MRQRGIMQLKFFIRIGAFHMENNEQVVTLCQKLLQIPSFSGEEKRIAEFLIETMQTLGFDEVTIDRYGSVLGCMHGTKPGKHILLDGHIDTVRIAKPEEWTHDPFGGKIEGERLYGRGASDMKGGVASMVTAVADFARETGKDFAGDIYVSCSVQEELFEGVSCREVIKNARPDLVIIGEATSTTLKIGQRGRAEVVVETEGVPCHSSNPEKGVNAVYHMATLIEEIRRIVPNEHPLLGQGILELTDIISDPYPGSSVVPAKCQATFDRRLLVGETEESVLAQIGEAIKKTKVVVPNLKARAFLAEGENRCWTGEPLRSKRFFPAWAMEESCDLVRSAMTGLRAAGIEAPISHYAFCTNGSSFCGEAGIPTVGFGPSLESLAHTVDEYIELEQLNRAVRGYCGILRELTR
jgi:putative selenium metabolism hydrolase